VNPVRQFVDFGSIAGNMTIMANARRKLKSKKSSHRGIGFPLARA